MKEKQFDFKDPKNRFWELIQNANGDKKTFYDILYRFSLEELIEFKGEFTKAEEKLWTIDHYEAMGISISEDTFDDTRLYVVSQGSDYYFDVLNNPSKMIKGGVEIDDPKLIYWAIGEVSWDKFEEDI